jgi:hypothetical protein
VPARIDRDEATALAEQQILVLRIPVHRPTDASALRQLDGMSLRLVELMSTDRCAGAAARPRSVGMPPPAKGQPS